MNIVLIIDIFYAQKTKAYTDRLANYLDQWRFHILSEMGNGIAKCRPLWDVLEGIKLLLCNHFLGNLVRIKLRNLRKIFKNIV